MQRGGGSLHRRGWLNSNDIMALGSQPSSITATACAHIQNGCGALGQQISKPAVDSVRSYLFIFRYDCRSIGVVPSDRIYHSPRTQLVYNV